MISRNSWKWLVALGAVFVPATVLGVVLPHRFTAGTPIVADEVNADFAALETAVTTLETTKADLPATGALAPSARGVVSYAYVYNCAATTCSVSPGYAYNSDGAIPTASRGAIGVYSVTWPGSPLAGGGHVQVSAYGSGPNFCSVGGWGDSNVNVYCYTHAGAAVDSAFTILIIN